MYLPKFAVETKKQVFIVQTNDQERAVKMIELKYPELEVLEVTRLGGQND